METKTHWKKNFNYEYLGSYSLDEGQSVTLKIKKVVKKAVTSTNGKKDDCTVAYFEGESKPMVLNKTNCKTITKIYGTPYIEDWMGKYITIKSVEVEAFGDVVDALRVVPKQPKSELPELTEDHEKWAKVVDALRAGNTTIEGIKKHFELSKEIETRLKSETDFS